MSTFPAEFAPVAPPADGLRLAFVAARRRRNLKAGAVGAAGLLAVVAFLASAVGAGERTLMQEPLPPSSTRGLGVLTDTGMPSAPSTSPPTAVPSGEVTGRPRLQVQVPGTATVDAKDDKTTTPSRARLSAPNQQPVSGPMRRTSALLYTGGDVTCPARKQQERQRALCTDVYAGSDTDGNMSLTAEICNVGTATELLSYGTARELDLAVRRAGTQVWRWSLGRNFSATRHDLTVGAQECIVWTTTWRLVDSQGRRVQAGDYEVVADLDAEQVSTADKHPSYPITISPQP